MHVVVEPMYTLMLLCTTSACFEVCTVLGVSTVYCVGRVHCVLCWACPLCTVLGVSTLYCVERVHFVLC